MSKIRKYVIVHFADHKSAQDAFKAFRAKFPSQLPTSEDLSRVENETVYIQEDSFYIASNLAKSFLLECYGALPFPG